MSLNNMENYDDMNKLDDVDTDILDSLGINTLNDPLVPKNSEKDKQRMVRMGTWEAHAGKKEKNIDRNGSGISMWHFCNLFIAW